ncbi:MAG: hypothetical protein NC397_07730 [Clostridium sp.]|nr:hypothetical protein [Clostridium sp.]
MKMLDMILCGGATINSLIKDEQYNNLYIETQRQLYEITQKLPKELSADVNELCDNYEKLLVRAEVEGFKLGIKSGIELNRMY